MDKSGLNGKSSNSIPRATRPGVVQITTHNDDNVSIASIATTSRTSLVEEVEEEGHNNNPVTIILGEQPVETTPSDDVLNNNSVSQDQGQQDALTITGDEVTEADDDDENSHNQQQQQGGTHIPDEEIREGEAEVNVVIPEEDLVIDAQVELAVEGNAAERHDNDGNNVDEEQQQQQEVMSIQLTQSSFPIAQPVNISYEEEEDEEGEGQETEDTQDGGGGVDLSLHESIHSSCHSIIIMQEQQVVVATMNDVERQQDHHRPLQQQQEEQSEEILSSSSLTDGRGENKFRMFPRRRSRRIMCYVAIGVLVIAACVIGTVLSVKKSGSSTYSDTNDGFDDLGGSKDICINDNVDTNFVEVLLKSFLESMGTNEHKIPGTPQYKALQWLYESAREDSEEFNLTEWTIRDLLAQRYVLAVFYFATGGDGESNDNSSGGWDDNCAFLSAKSECEWKCSTKSNNDGIDLGIACDESSRIQKIILPSNNLSGMIPKEFQSLTFLTELDMSNNNIVGQLPNDVGDLKNLKSFNAAHNELTGGLPPSIGNLSFLRELNLMNNNLDGVVPLTVARLRSLEVLLLNGNNFSGGLDNFCTNQSRSVLRNRQLRSRLSSFFSDCSYSADYTVQCDCCTHCCVSGMPISSCQLNENI